MQSMRPGFQTSLAVGLNVAHGNDLRSFASLRMTEEDPVKIVSRIPARLIHR